MDEKSSSNSKEMKMSKGRKQSSVYDTSDRGKGFAQKGIPSKEFWEANEGKASGKMDSDDGQNEGKGN